MDGWKRVGGREVAAAETQAQEKGCTQGHARDQQNAARKGCTHAMEHEDKDALALSDATDCTLQRTHSTDRAPVKRPACTDCLVRSKGASQKAPVTSPIIAATKRTCKTTDPDNKLDGEAALMRVASPKALGHISLSVLVPVVRCSAMLVVGIPPHSTPLHCTALHCAALYNTVLHCSDCTILYYTVLHCTNGTVCGSNSAPVF